MELHYGIFFFARQHKPLAFKIKNIIKATSAQGKTHSHRCDFCLHSPLHGKARSGGLTDGVSRKRILSLTAPYVQAANPK